jgi:hypothetical protein
MSNYSKSLEGNQRDQYISQRFQREINVEFPIGKMGSSDIESMNIVIDTYKDKASGEFIEFSGWNDQSGYAYIALESGIQIASCFGQDPDFIVYDHETEEEIFLDSFEEAQEYLETKF